MGRHVNADANADDIAADPEGAEPEQESARHAAESGGHPLEAQAVISADTHVGTDFDELAPGTPDAAASPADPDALVVHGLVGDGHEME